MKLFNIFKKQPSEANEHAHAVVEKKGKEAHDILNEVQGKLMEISREIEQDNKKTTLDLERKSKKIRDVAAQIAIITSGGKQ
jgi:hypothetical protein